MPGELTLQLDRTEALELLAVVQATLNAIARSRELVVGAAILTGVREKLIDALESDSSMERTDMRTTPSALDRLADAALAELSDVRPRDDAAGAAVAAAALLARRAALEVVDRDRVIRIARREGATLRTLAEATGLSRQTIANICRTAAGSSPPGRRSSGVPGRQRAS